MDASGTGNLDMGYFRAPHAQVLSAQRGHGGPIGISRLTCDAPEPGLLDAHVVEDAFLFSLQLRRVQAHLTVDGKAVSLDGQTEGRLTAYDYRRKWTCDIRTPYDMFNLHVPKSAFDSLAHDYGGRLFEDLCLLPSESVDDPVMRALAAAASPALQSPKCTNALFVDHVGWAAVAHVAGTYGQYLPLRPRAAARLAPWQERRAKQMIDAQLGADLRLSELAEACSLSPTYFSRAFSQTTGLPPHRWLLKRRVEVAQSLLLTTGLPLAEIAACCGFCDQSHFTRVFLKSVGATPGSWRRQRRH